MAHASTVRSASRTSSLRRLLWMTLPAAAVAALMLTPRAHAQNTSAPTTGAGAPAAGTGSAPAFNPSADISRAVSRDTTDSAIQNNWNSIMNPAKPKAEEKPVETPRRARRGINTGVSTN